MAGKGLTVQVKSFRGLFSEPVTLWHRYPPCGQERKKDGQVRTGCANRIRNGDGRKNIRVLTHHSGSWAQSLRSIPPFFFPPPAPGCRFHSITLHNDRTYSWQPCHTAIQPQSSLPRSQPILPRIFTAFPGFTVSLQPKDCSVNLQSLPPSLAVWVAGGDFFSPNIDMSST